MRYFLVCLLFAVAPPLRADSECAPLLASSFQSRELSATDKFRAYMVDLLEGGELGFDVFADFSRNLNEGVFANPVTEDVALRNWELHFHRSLLQEYVDSGELDVEQLRVWALERLAKMKGDQGRRKVVSEKTQEIPDLDVTSPKFWETDKNLRYLFVREKVSGENKKVIGYTSGIYYEIERSLVREMEAIHFAAEYASLEVFQRFVEMYQKELDIDAKDKHGYTAFWRALWSGRFDIADYLLEKGANIEAPDKNGYRPIHLAAHKRNLPMAEFLLDRGANIHTATNGGETPWFLAMADDRSTAIAGVSDIRWPGSIPLAQLFLKHGVDVDERRASTGKTALFTSAYNTDEKMMEFLVAQGADGTQIQDSAGRTPEKMLKFAKRWGWHRVPHKQKGKKKTMFKRLVDALRIGN